jgi:peptidoglycan/LPS O-acetylase OafA/YrhL
MWRALSLKEGDNYRGKQGSLSLLPKGGGSVPPKKSQCLRRLKFVAGLMATIGGALTLKILTDVENWDWRWLVVSGFFLVGGTFVVRFVPDFYYRRSRLRWVRILTGITAAIGGLVALSALHPPSDWQWWHWLGTGILVVSGVIYLLLPDFQRQNLSNQSVSISKALRRLFKNPN